MQVLKSTIRTTLHWLMKRDTIKEEQYLENNRLTGQVEKGLNVSYFITIF